MRSTNCLLKPTLCPHTLHTVATWVILCRLPLTWSNSGRFIENRGLICKFISPGIIPFLSTYQILWQKIWNHKNMVIVLRIEEDAVDPRLVATFRTGTCLKVPSSVSTISGYRLFFNWALYARVSVLGNSTWLSFSIRFTMGRICSPFAFDAVSTFKRYLSRFKRYFHVLAF